MRKCQLLVEMLRKRFQVTVRGVDMFEELFASPVGDVGCRNGDCLHTYRMTCLRRVNRILGPDNRIVVSERDTLTSQLFAAAAIISGVACSLSLSTSRDLEMDQF